MYILPSSGPACGIILDFLFVVVVPELKLIEFRVVVVGRRRGQDELGGDPNNGGGPSLCQ